MPKKIPTKTVVQVDAFAVVSRAIDEGVDRGWNRAHKHTESPDVEYLRGQICDAVTEALCEVLDFPDKD